MQQAFLEINGVKTNVLTYGKWVEESFKPSEPKDIVLVIPGNPGLTGFYKMFMHTLNEKTGFPVWCVAHAGHEIPKKNPLFSIQRLKGNEGLFGLRGQVEHKLDFIKKYVPEGARLHLVGHSIGSYMILELLKEELVREKVVDVKLLFPTFEYMAETANGKFLNFVKPFIWLIVFLSWIYTLLPSILSNFLMYIYMEINSIPKMHFRVLVQLVEPSILQKVFFLAYEELEFVKERNASLIKENCNKIKFLYGHKDGWAPPAYRDSLKKDIPEANTEMSQFDHTFVLKQSREVGSIVADWIVAN
ncbi:lipid droplet-associated hydrolase [Tribolium madens]|uniref:lipid droplet-associated hydrolase n=1 Tax=Tribolium madens TaxID=41895 RepID=UPI001CF75E8D|nr:lipid droplet-associated hydrolase [Tribolium madens]XP_044272645.1 lipid droplet-associated hydrolase [Tribolium madens]XP_044272646.1 lipid droplet-associated hydrolase [Tribolium madens]